MSCSVAVSSSPVFSPSSTLFYNKASMISPSHEALTLTLTHLKPPHSSSSSSSAALSSPKSPSSPFRIRLAKPPTGLSSPSISASGSSTTSPSTILKRKRPARLAIPVATSFVAPGTPSVAAREVVEEEGDGYSVYCKRGRREAMEDRYSAVLNVQGDSKQVIFSKLLFIIIYFSLQFKICL
jgi:protein phosphatase 1L